MSTRRESFDNRCKRCLVNANLCFCEKLSTISTQTKVSFIMHVKELALTSNTARICHLALKNSNIYIRGSINNLDFSKVYSPDPNYFQLYLYPTEDSIALSLDLIESLKKPIELVVPDASWNQAKKFHKREKIFKSMQKVHLINQEKSKYGLRAQKYDKGVCTLEAVAYALDIIENENIKRHLFDILDAMNISNLKARQRI